MRTDRLVARVLLFSSITIVLVACADWVVAQPDPFAGKPTSRAADEIQIEKWAKDGGGYARVKAAAGKRFLIVTFPDAVAGQKVVYDAKDFDVTVEGQSGVIRPYGVTVWSKIDADAIKPDVAYSELRLAKPRPISMAFEIPATAKSATLRIKGAKTSLRW